MKKYKIDEVHGDWDEIIVVTEVMDLHGATFTIELQHPCIEDWSLGDSFDIGAEQLEALISVLQKVNGKYNQWKEKKGAVR